jgi:Ca2+/Na+ antiporter
MTDRQLIRGLMLDFVSGVALGGVFASLLLYLNVQHLSDAVQSSDAPRTLGTILVAGCSFYFGMGATITGFHFALMGHETE